MANTVSIDALRQEVWGKDLYRDVINNLYFTQNGMMGTDINNIVQLKDELSKEKGDTATFGISVRMTGNGITGDSDLEGNEEAILTYSEQIAIDQIRFGVRLTGKLDEQKAAYNMRNDAKDKLKQRLIEMTERQIFLKMQGITNLTLTDVNAVVVSALATWSNTPEYVPDADDAAGSGARYVCACATGLDAIAVTDLITPQLISMAKLKAITANPQIQPLRVGGKDYYVLFIHPYQAFDLHQNATWSQAMREAEVRGKDNPIFTGADGIWDGVIVHSHPYCSFCDASGQGYGFRSTAAGTVVLADTFRASLCGQQAVGMVKCTNNNKWVEKSFDYENKIGFATSFIGGFQKIQFATLAKDYAVVTLDSSSSIIVA